MAVATEASMAVVVMAAEARAAAATVVEATVAEATEATMAAARCTPTHQNPRRPSRATHCRILRSARQPNIMSH